MPMKRHICETNVIWALMTCSKTLDPQTVRKNWKGLGDDLVQLSHFIDKPRPRIFSDLFKVIWLSSWPSRYNFSYSPQCPLPITISVPGIRAKGENHFFYNIRRYWTTFELFIILIIILPNNHHLLDFS